VVAGSEPPFTLLPGGTEHVTVTIVIPELEEVRGLIDTTVVTATSATSPTLVERVIDRTMVPRMRVYLPIALRNTP
jgi:hypothetical protein